MFAETAQGLLVLAHLMMPVNQGAQLATVTTTSTTTTTVAASGATDYRASCGLVYTFESEANADSADASGTVGAPCDGTDNGSIQRTTGIQGSTAANFTSGTQYFSVTNSTCIDYIDSGSASDKTIVLLVKPTVANSSARSFTGDYTGSGTTGYLTRWHAGDGASNTGRWSFLINGSYLYGTTYLQLNTTYAMGFVYDDTAHTRTLYVNASEENTGSVTMSAVDPPATTVRFGSTSTNLGAIIDDVAVCNFKATPAQLCQIASCGIDGSGCTCSGATYTDAGLNTTFGSCSLTGQDCNAAAP